MLYFHKGLSRRACRTVGRALTLAGREGCPAADTGHLLLAMLETDAGPAAEFLRGKRVTGSALRECTARRSCGAAPMRLGRRDLAPESRKALEFAQLGAQAARAPRAENEHLLCAMLEDCGCTASVWLAELGVEVPQAARECRQLSGQLVLPAQPRMSASRASRPSEKYGRDLTRLAQEGQLDPVLCRDAELERMIEILCRRQKNNPCLLGEPGVGKSALAEALAQRIAEGRVTRSLQGKRVLALDMASMVAGTKYRGDFEERFKNLLEELYRDRSTILFIDEIHVIAGAGAAEGAIDAASILKPMLARGEIQLIGATTPEEYRKTIGKDSALDRRFGKVMVEEPAPADAEKILAGLMPRYERYHGVTIPAEAIHAAVELSVRYLPGRYLPDKAIDLLDEACACAALRNKKLEEYDEAQLSLTREKNREQELSNPTGGAQVDYEELAKTHYRIATLEESLDKLKSEGVFAQVEEQDVAKVIELWTGIPAARVQENELKKLAHLEDVLKKHIIGQDEAVNAISAAIRRSRVQISPRRHPASFIFVGPTGTGKTELVRVLSQELFDTPETLIRLDMSEFMEKHSVSKIIGSPPGYVGYDEAGQLTEKVRRRPYSVLLFDEIEKAHPDVLNILLQILDEGRITDAHGRTVNFENTVIVMTSNAGSDRRENALGFNKTAADMNREKVMKALGEFLRPEFLSRIDEVIVFRPLDVEDYKSIAALMLDEYVSSLGEKGITLTYTPEVCAYLAEKSIHGQSGARDLRNNIRRMVEDKLAMILVEQGEGAVSGVGLTMEGQDLKLNVL